MKKSSQKTGRRFFLPAILGALLLLVLLAFDQRMMIRTYTVEAAEIDSPIRLVVVTDLHSCRYGDGQKRLIDAVIKQQPDLLLLVGDIFDDIIADTNTELFLAGVAGKFPIHFVTGNHEYWAGEEAFAAKMAILEKHGVTVLSGDCETLTVNGETFNLCGVDDPAAFTEDPNAIGFVQQLNTLHKAAENGHYTILLSHRPEYFMLYEARDFDLVLCGHAHGGQWRIPGILNGVYAPHQGMLPKYAGGRYDGEDVTMIVSRGLARETTRVPRIFNRPEVVVVEIK